MVIVCVSYSNISNWGMLCGIEDVMNSESQSQIQDTRHMIIYDGHASRIRNWKMNLKY